MVKVYVRCTFLLFYRFISHFRSPFTFHTLSHCNWTRAFLQKKTNIENNEAKQVRKQMYAMCTCSCCCCYSILRNYPMARIQNVCKMRGKKMREYHFRFCLFVFLFSLVSSCLFFFFFYYCITIFFLFHFYTN